MCLSKVGRVDDWVAEAGDTCDATPSCEAESSSNDHSLFHHARSHYATDTCLCCDVSPPHACGAHPVPRQNREEPTRSVVRRDFRHSVSFNMPVPECPTRYNPNIRSNEIDTVVLTLLIDITFHLPSNPIYTRCV
jgi:hypothetical protein